MFGGSTRRFDSRQSRVAWQQMISVRKILRPAAILLMALVGVVPVSADQRVRIMAANTTTGDNQSYNDGEGIRIFQGLAPDVALIQEFNFRNNSAADYRAFVDTAFGPSFEFFVEPGNEQIPNGIVSRYPIIASGEWIDSEVSNRDFAWARIDIPGDRHLWAVSVHLLTSGAGVRGSEAQALVNFIENEVPEEDYLVVGGDFNTANFSEIALSRLSAVVDTSGRADDQRGTTGTNRSRQSPFDQVLPEPDLDALEIPVTIAGNNFTYPDGLVFDSRVFTPISAVPPILASDSNGPNMQHQAVIRDFLIPDGNASPEPAEFPTDFVAAADGDSITLSWVDSSVDPVPEAYLILAEANGAITPPTDGIPESDDVDLSDGSATINIAQGSGTVSFSGLPPGVSYTFQIFPYIDTISPNYKTFGTVPTTSAITDAAIAPPIPGPVFYPHATGFTASWSDVPEAAGYRIDVSTSPTFSGGAGAALLDTGFDSSTSVPGGFVDGGTTNDSIASHYSSPSNCRALGSGDTLETPSSDFPAALSFYADASNNGDGNTATISYSVGGASWQPLTTFTVSRDGTQESIDLTASPDLRAQTDVRFRFESSFSTWYLDDVILTGASGEQFVPGYENLDVGDVLNVAITGLDPSTQYYFRVRAVNSDEEISFSSTTASAITRDTGTPFTNWALDNGIDPPTDDSNFDGDSLTDLQEYLFGTDPAQPGPASEAIAFEISPTGFQARIRQSFAPGATFDYFGSTTLIFGETALQEGMSVGEYRVLSTEQFGFFQEQVIGVNTTGVPRFFFRVRAESP